MISVKCNQLLPGISTFNCICTDLKLTCIPIMPKPDCTFILIEVLVNSKNIIISMALMLTLYASTQKPTTLITSLSF